MCVRITGIFLFCCPKLLPRFTLTFIVNISSITSACNRGKYMYTLLVYYIYIYNLFESSTINLKSNRRNRSNKHCFPRLCGTNYSVLCDPKVDMLCMLI